MIVAGFSAYSQILDFPRFREIADKVGAYLFVDMAHVAGLVAAGVYPNPVLFAENFCVRHVCFFTSTLMFTLIRKTSASKDAEAVSNQ